MTRGPVVPCLPSLATLLLVAAILDPSRVLARPASAPGNWARAPSHFVFLRQFEPGSLRPFLRDVDRAGGHVAIVYPPDAAVILGDRSVLGHPELGRWLGRVERGRVPDDAALPAGARRAARIWNASLRFDSVDVASVATGRGRDLVLPGPHGALAPLGAADGPRARPYGAYDADQSEYMAGTVAAGIWLLESPGAENDWSPEEEAETIGGIQAGMENWVRKGGPPARLTFVFDLHTGVMLSGDPLSDCGAYDQWMREALESAGYTGHVYGGNAAAVYNNDLRTSHDTDWAFSLFVVDTPEGYGGFCAPIGSYAWAALGGPWVYMYRFTSWAFASTIYHAAVPMHEVGHTFYATDEYDGYASRSGYLNAFDLLSPACIMNANDSSTVCAGSRAQLGWADTDGDGVVDPLGAPPLVEATLSGGDPSPTPTLAYVGSATVGLVPNQNPFTKYAPPHDISVDRIAAVEGRVDGGAWQPATPVDGTFDGYSESFAWSSAPLPDGLRIVEFRAPTEFGGGGEASVRDSVWVLVNTTDRHPLIQAPAEASGPEGAEITIDVLAWDPDGEGIASLTADLAALPSGASFDVAGDQASGVFRWTPGFDEAGDYPVTFHAQNALTYATTCTIHVANADQVPAVTAPGVQNALEGRLLEFDVSASDPDGEPITTFTADVAALPAGHDATFTWDGVGPSGTFRWTPTCLDAGTHEVTFLARNNFQVSSYAEGQAHSTIVVENDCSIFISPIDDVVVMAGGEASTGVYVFDLNGGDVSVVAGLPAFATLETIYHFPGEFSGTIRMNPAAADTGQYAAEVVATIDGWSDVERFGIRVFAPVTTSVNTMDWVGTEIRATPEGVILRWRSTDGSMSVLSVDRSPDAATWSTRAVGVEAVSGMFTFEDREVVPGQRYAYRFWRSSGVERAYSQPLWVEVPAAEPVPPKPRVARIAPNPASGAVSIRYAVPAGGRATLAVVDVHGRLCRRLHEGALGRGWHAGDWDGRSGSGEPLPSGVYFIRLEAASGRSVQKVVLLR